MLPHETIFDRTSFIKFTDAPWHPLFVSLPGEKKHLIVSVFSFFGPGINSTL